MSSKLRWMMLAGAVAVTLWPGTAAAQHRIGVSVGFATGRYYPYYYYPYFGAWYGWYPYSFWRPYHPYPYPYFGYPYYPYPYDYTGSARIQVTPKDAEVYVDGYFVGQVDSFDGWAQRLHVELGEHEIQIYHPQFRTLRERVLLRPGATV